jgi:cell division protein FtsB
MRLKRLIIVAFVLFLLSLFSLNTWQGYRYERLKAEVAVLEREQRDWLDRNKRAIAGLAVLGSPARISELAQSKLGLVKPGREERTTLIFSSPTGGSR